MSSDPSVPTPVAPTDTAEAAERATAAVVAAMSHELRTPLAAITGSLQLLGEMSLDREEQRLVRIARQSAEALTHLLDDVLDFARVDAGVVELEAVEFEPERLLDSVVQLLAPRVSQQRVLLTTELDVALPGRLCMARDRLRQVLLNLASHAIRSSPGGEVALRLSQGTVGHLRLEVSDNGPAIPLARQASVFALRSRHEGGPVSAMDSAGVGLAMCQRLVELLGGHIGLTSSAGVGSTFWAELPWQKCTASLVMAPVMPVKRILMLVEGSLGQQVERQYAAWGMQVERVATATAAAAALEVGVDVRYDLFVVDLRIGRVPGGLPSTLLTEFRAAGVPVAALQDAFALASGSPRDPGVDHLLSVPLLLDELRQCLQSAIKASRVAPAERLFERRLRVLLADDSQSNRLVLTELLRRRGCEVDVATNGQEAVDSVLRAMHDVVILDIDMPVMDGVAALQAIRRLGGVQSRLPVVAMTAHAAPTARADFLTAGFDDYLAKPVDGGVLMETVARWATALRSATTEAVNVAHVAPAEAGAWLAQRGAERALETTALRRLAHEVGQDRLPRMVRIFSEELERRAGLILAAMEQGEIAVLGRESHVLKGSAATFGAHDLQRHATRLNEACRREARAEALECSGLLLATVPRTLESLRAALQEVER